MADHAPEPNRKRWFHHLLELSADTVEDDVRAAMVKFVIDHEAEAVLLGLWESTLHSFLTERIDRQQLEQELEAGRD